RFLEAAGVELLVAFLREQAGGAADGVVGGHGRRRRERDRDRGGPEESERRRVHPQKPQARPGRGLATGAIDFGLVDVSSSEVGTGMGTLSVSSACLRRSASSMARAVLAASSI